MAHKARSWSTSNSFAALDGPALRQPRLVAPGQVETGNVKRSVGEYAARLL